MVGKTLKSKINGSLYCVTELFTVDDCEYYALLDLACGNLIAVGKEQFEKLVMPNIEIVE